MVQTACLNGTAFRKPLIRIRTESMSLAVLLAPLILIMPAAEQSPAEDTSDRSAQLTQQPSASLMQGTMAEGIALSFRVQGANQVRIEQHSTIRVAPRPS